MIDMREYPELQVWEGCDPAVVKAIAHFKDRWGPYSASSRRYPIVGLIRDLIDPAVADFSMRLPKRYLGQAMPGCGTAASFSETARVLGLDAMVRFQRECLRKLLHFVDKHAASDERIIATFESLIELTFGCACKLPKKSKTSVQGINLNAERKQGFCRLCGKLTEFSAFITHKRWGAEDHISDEHDHLRLSHLYCTEHRPRKIDGTWNAEHKRAKRNKDSFDLELRRLSVQSSKPANPQAKSGNPAIDLYIRDYLAREMLQPADRAELRSEARRMVDAKLSDRKKQIAMMLASGLNQSEIARALGVSRQAVSKTVTSIPAAYLLGGS